MADELSALRGRGVAANPANRFELICYERDPDAGPDDPAPATQFFKDAYTQSLRTQRPAARLLPQTSREPHRFARAGLQGPHSGPCEVELVRRARWQ